MQLQTPWGEVWLWGPAPRGRPLLLIVTGAFADPGTLDHVGRVFPAIDVLRTHIPGNACPVLTETSVAAFAAALSDALRQAVPEAPIGILGLSLGALVSLGVRVPNLRRLLLVEPPLLTEPTWHLAEHYRVAEGSAEAALLWEIFGIRDRTVEAARDYSGLLTDLAVPAEVLIGDVPAEPRRPMDKAPSFVGPTALALLARHPRISTTIAPGAGHNVPVQAPLVLYDAITRLVADLTQPAGAARGTAP
jgi:hypothetical protein